MTVAIGRAIDATAVSCGHSAMEEWRVVRVKMPRSETKRGLHDASTSVVDQ